MKHLALLLFVGAVVCGNSGCCCLGHKMHRWKQSLHCHGCGGPRGDYDLIAAAECGCGNAACAGDCGHGDCSHGDCAPSSGNCGGGCSTCGGGGGGSCSGGWGGFNWGLGSSGCSILGCSSHYLDPKGACYGAYCGTCCEKAGCGPKYWGDWFNVPRTTEPCDCCANFVGPSHSFHGSTPWYYGPPPQYANPGYGSPCLTSGPAVHGEHVVSDEYVSQPTSTRTVTKPAARPSSTKRR
jgi:hypothetical protein